MPEKSINKNTKIAQLLKNEDMTLQEFAQMIKYM